MNLVHPVGFRKGVSFLWNSAAHSFNADTKQAMPVEAGGRDAIPGVVKTYLRRRGVYALIASSSRSRFSNIVKIRLLYLPIRHGYGRKARLRYKKLFLQLTRPKANRSLLTWGSLEKLHGFMVDILSDRFYSWKYRSLASIGWARLFFRRAYKDREKYRLNLYLTRVLLRGSRRYSWAKSGSLSPLLTKTRFMSSGREIGWQSVERSAEFTRRFRSYARFNPFRRYRRINWRLKREWWFGEPRRFWKRRWNHSRHRLGINKHMLAHLFSSSLGKAVKIKLTNIFGYAAKKNLLNWHTHQQFLWGDRYRSFRFKFPEYQDIVGAAFLMCAYPREANVLTQHFLWVMYKTLRTSYRIKKFFRFISIFIEHYQLLRRNFRVFLLVLAGKIGGGTKRTKLLKFGYGRLVLQSVHKNLSRNFMPFDHKWGAFGMKLFTVRREVLDPRIPNRALVDD